MSAHWGVPDPVAADGSDEQRRRAFESAWAMLRQRIERLLALPLDQLDRAALQRELHAIGHAEAIHE